MNWKTYQKEAVKTLSGGNYPPTKENHNLHMLMGMMTELGELTDPFKKEFAYNKSIDWVNVEEELFDLLWYIACFCEINDIDFEKGLQTNIDKLRERYPERFFTSDRAINRNLGRERKVLENGN